jgi:hypothetical protein
MSNKKKIASAFESQFSIEKNYKSIIDKIDKKDSKKKFYLNWSLAPILAALLLFISLPIMLGNDDIYVNNLQEAVIPIATFRMYQSSEYDVKSKYPFVENIKIPKYLDQSEEGITFIQLEELEIHDYILAYYNNESNKSIRISFTKKGIDSFISKELDIENVKTSKVSNQEVIIAKYENNYYAKLEYKDLIFNIEANNIELNELVNIIKTILK